MLCIAEDGLPHQCTHRFAMTVIFDDFRIITGAHGNETYVIARRLTKWPTWQSASLYPNDAGLPTVAVFP